MEKKKSSKNGSPKPITDSLNELFDGSGIEPINDSEGDDEDCISDMPFEPTGQIRTAHDLRQERYRNRLYRAGIPSKYRDYTFSSMTPADDAEHNPWMEGEKLRALNMARNYVDESGLDQRGYTRLCLFFSGRFGTGKTTLATATFKEFMWRYDVEGRWLKFYSFTRYVQAGYATGEADQRIKEIQRVPILLLDDVGDIVRDGMQTDDKRQLLYEILDWRNDNAAFTILTTNLDEQGLIKQFGERTFQRILEMCAMVRLDGSNLRLTYSPV